MHKAARYFPFWVIWVSSYLTAKSVPGCVAKTNDAVKDPNSHPDNMRCWWGKSATEVLQAIWLSIRHGRKPVCVDINTGKSNGYREVAILTRHPDRIAYAVYKISDEKLWENGFDSFDEWKQSLGVRDIDESTVWREVSLRAYFLQFCPSNQIPIET